MPVGVYKLGGGVSCLSCRNHNTCFLPMTYTVWKTNDFYYKPGNRANWTRRSKPSGGQNWGKQNASRIGVNRLGGSAKN